MIRNHLAESSGASVEDVITAVWADVLQTDVSGRDASFFALGGTSLQAARMIGKLRDALDVRIPLNLLFETHTVEGLAREIERLRRVAPGRAATIQPCQERTGERFRAPTSFAQRRLWVEEQLLGPSATYNVPCAVEVQGPLDLDSLRAALASLIARHEIFRTTFRAVGGVPEQVITAELDTPFSVTSLLDIPVDEREQAVIDHLFQAARRPFDLERGPLLRAELLRLEEEWNVLLLNMHHIITDGQSFEIAIAELLEDYAAHVKGETPAPRVLPVQYADFAAWQQLTIGAEQFDEQLAYWKNRLRGPLPVLELPTDVVAAETPSGLGANVSIGLRRALARRIAELSRRHGATPFMTVLMALNVLLHRYSGQTDIVVGAPNAGRQLPEMETMLGYFVNTLALRCDLSADPTVEKLLVHVRDVALGAYTNQDVPFERVVNSVSGNRSARQNLFRVVLTYRQELPTPVVPGLTVTPLDMDTDTVKFDLVVVVTEADSELRLALAYNADLFTEDTARRMLGHLSSVLEAAVAAPSTRISQLPILTEQEQQQMEQWSTASDEPYPADRCLHQMFEEQADRTPTAAAIESGAQLLSYRELDQRADLLAARLRASGVGAEQVVGLCVEPSIELVVGILGILKTGAAYVPIGPLVPSERAAFMIADSGARLMVTTSRVYDRLSKSSTEDVEVVYIDDSAEERTPAAQSEVRPGQLAYVLYTSGTTGRPKGVAVTHDNVVPLIRWGNEAMAVGPGDRVLQNASYQFDWSIEEIFHTLTSGACLVVLPPDVRADPYTTVRFVNEHRITALYMTPAQMRGVAATGVGMPVLRYVSFAGEKLGADLVEQTRARVSPRCQIWNEYGPTEAAIVAVAAQVGEPVAGLTSPLLGRPIANATCAVVDLYGEPQPVGVTGELLLGGDGVARGYHNQPALTAEHFRPDPANPGRRVYRTGDLVRWQPDGQLEYLGRNDQQIKLRGVRIELEEIEAVLRGHGGISDVVVVLHDSDHLIAYVVAQPGTTLDDTELRNFIAPKLPSVMRPSVFVPILSLPITTNGKVDRKSLPGLGGETVSSFVSTAPVAPRTELETIVAAIWAEVLELDSVDVHANFFGLGGDSLKYLSMVERLRETLEMAIPIRAVVDAGTVAALCEQIEVLRWTAHMQGHVLELTGEREMGEL